jgi:hypothetical protein
MASAARQCLLNKHHNGNYQLWSLLIIEPRHCLEKYKLNLLQEVFLQNIQNILNICKTRKGGAL